MALASHTGNQTRASTYQTPRPPFLIGSGMAYRPSDPDLHISGPAQRQTGPVSIQDALAHLYLIGYPMGSGASVSDCGICPQNFLELLAFSAFEKSHNPFCWVGKSHTQLASRLLRLPSWTPSAAFFELAGRRAGGLS